MCRWISTYRCHILTKLPLALGKFLVDPLNRPFHTHFPSGLSHLE